MIHSIEQLNHYHKEKDQMSLIDIKSVKDEALNEVTKERADKAKNALVKKLRELETAKEVVRNIERSVADLEASIADGSFTG